MSEKNERPDAIVAMRRDPNVEFVKGSQDGVCSECGFTVGIAPSSMPFVVMQIPVICMTCMSAKIHELGEPRILPPTQQARQEIIDALFRDALWREP